MKIKTNLVEAILEAGLSRKDAESYIQMNQRETQGKCTCTDSTCPAHPKSRMCHAKGTSEVHGPTGSGKMCEPCKKFAQKTAYGSNG